MDRVASQRVKTIANEDEIDADIASTDTLMLIMKEMQSSADSQRNRAAQLQKDLEDLKKNQPNNQTTQTQQEPENELAKQLQTLTELVTTMQTERAAEKKKIHAEAIISQVHEKMKSKGCTNDFIRNMTLKGIEVAESDTADSLAEKYKPVYDQNCKDAYGDGYVPPMGMQNANGGFKSGDFASEVERLKASGKISK
ncbi:MAG: hypothetical protein IJD91_08560 [Clostridia bacterium]|nr:hypothetical protein [Clostridia bacterium]